MRASIHQPITFERPAHVGAALPESVVLSSTPLGWRGLVMTKRDFQPHGHVRFSAGSDEHFLLIQPVPVGYCRAVVDGEVAEGPADRGALDLIPAACPFEYLWDCPQTPPRSLHLYFSPAYLDEVASAELDLGQVRLRTCQRVKDAALVDIAFLLLRELEGDAVGTRLYAECLITALVVRLLRDYSCRPPQPHAGCSALDKRRLRAVFAYIEDNLDTNLSLADLAAVAHRSAYHFARQFKRATGQAPHQYIIARRIERAKRLLREGRLTLTQVSAACGFSDQSHFTKHFKRLVGVTPKRFV